MSDPNISIPQSLEVEAYELGADIRSESNNALRNDPTAVAETMRGVAKAFPKDPWAQYLAKKYEALAEDPEAFAAEQARLDAFDDKASGIDREI